MKRKKIGPEFWIGHPFKSDWVRIKTSGFTIFEFGFYSNVFVIGSDSNFDRSNPNLIHW